MLTKISEITLDDVKNYLRIEHDIDDLELQSYMSVAKSYIVNYTNLAIQDVENIEEFAIPYLMLINNFYTNKSVLVDSNTKLDLVFSSILGLHKMYL